MSRSRWAVLLGPPLILALAVEGGSAAAGRAAPDAAALAIPRPLGACPPAPALPPGHGVAVHAPAIGAWWRSTPELDATGALASWTLTAGDGAGRTYRLDLPAASTVSGPDHGRVIAAVDDGARSALRIVDVTAGCARAIDLGSVVVRRAIADPTGTGFLAHLLARAGRGDLGVWHVAPDGRRTPILAPVDGATLHAAGIDRTWATNLAVSPDGTRLAVQSCDPEACVTRVLDRRSGQVNRLSGDQGDLVGFAGEDVITMAACQGLPCGVLAWNLDGTATAIAGDTAGAAVTRDGLVVIAAPLGSALVRAVAIDPSTATRRDIGDLAADTVLLTAGGDAGGIEADPDAIGFVNPTGSPSTLEVQP